jgi:hypothetical protein
MEEVDGSNSSRSTKKFQTLIAFAGRTQPPEPNWSLISRGNTRFLDPESQGRCECSFPLEKHEKADAQFIISARKLRALQNQLDGVGERTGSAKAVFSGNAPLALAPQTE